MAAARRSALCWCLLVVALWFGREAAEGGDVAGIYELKRGPFSAKLTNFGATLLSVMVPDRNGKVDDIVLGFETIDEYKNDTTYFGALIGRVGNRIAGAQFTLKGVRYSLKPNDGNNSLHGGPKGFSEVVWKVRSYRPDSHVSFTYHSQDGEEGFPGDLDVCVTYMLIETNKLAIKMEAKALNKATPVNLISHAYWNLAGHDSGDILGHNLQVFGSKITPLNRELIPTGEIVGVEGTAYDFRRPCLVGSRINELPDGYNINYVLENTSGGQHLTKAAVVQESKSGRRMELWTDQPGVQLYTSNGMGGVKGKGGAVYNNHAGLCLETQGFPDAVNQPNFPSVIVNPGETYRHVMVHRFTAK
ncbi:uncharacterized protein LOC127789690 [Diospyros lotus]|uniref:uncharacterized protein LOC127789690 n=1 Tax=Diospyros lotus TaxID=55363 RepID=UPI00224E9A29|nr:uncharacterized protein LOC127789690 [Diospyros lotus]